MAGLGYTEEQFNNLTGNIELNPGSFGLFMRDIEEASLNLKTAIYSGNINLTADIYKQLESLSEKKYNAIEPDGSINATRLGDTTMVGKTAGLYMNHQSLGFWNGNSWKAYIGNTGEMWLGSISETNYLHWDGTNLNIHGNITMTGGQVSWNYVIDKPNIPVLPSYITSTKITSTTIESPIISANYGLITGTLKVGNSGGTIDIIGSSKVIRSSNYSQGNTGWQIDSTGNAEFNNVSVRGNIIATSGEFSGNITSTATITGGIFRTSSSGARIEIGSTDGIICKDDKGKTRIRLAIPGIIGGKIVHPALSFFDPVGNNLGEIRPGDLGIISDGLYCSNNFGLRYGKKLYLGDTCLGYDSSSFTPMWSKEGLIAYPIPIITSTDSQSLTANIKLRITVGRFEYYILAQTI